MTTNWTKTKKDFWEKNDTIMKTEKKVLKSIKADILRDLNLLLKSRHQEL